MIPFTEHTVDTAPETIKETLKNVGAKYNFIPSLFSFMAEAPTTVEAYLSLNALVSQTSLTPVEQQIALLAASVENDCEFCIVAHRAFGKMNNVSATTIDAILNHAEISNAKENALVNFTQTIVSKRGRPSDAELDDFVNAGFTKQQILEVVLIVSIKTLSNYINHLTLPTPNKELLAML